MLSNKKKTKKIRKYSRRTGKFMHLKRKKILVRTAWTTGIIGGIVVLLYLYHISIGAQKFQLETVTFDEVSLETLDYLPLYATISAQIKGRNYLLTKRLGMDKLLTTIQADHPIVSSLEIALVADQTAMVKVHFHTPTIVFQTPDRRYISYDQQLYPVTDDSPLAYTILPVQLPAFTSGWDDIYGVFRQISEQQLKAATDIILTTLGSAAVQELIYQPGGQQLFLTYKGKRVFLNLRKDLNVQLEKLLTLENDRPGFSSIRTIDLGSRDEVIVK